MRYNIVVQHEEPVGGWEDEHKPIILGIVEFLKESEAHVIEELWREFQATEPDTDSQFVEFLTERGYSVQPYMETGTIVLNG